MDTRGRDISWKVFLGIVVVYLAVIKVSGLILGHGLDTPSGTIPDVESLLRQTLIPVALSVVFGIGVATWLGWWPRILHDTKPVQRWVRIVPVLMLVASVVAIDYGNLFGQTAGLALSFVLLVILIGFGEELMFRGIGVTAFRDGGFTEGKVALYSSIIFGAAHLSNAIDTGTAAIFQAAVVSFAGYFLYLCRRVGAGLLLPVIVHGTWDFALLSGSLGPKGDIYVLAILPMLTIITLAVVLFVRRRKIEPAPA